MAKKKAEKKNVKTDEEFVKKVEVTGPESSIKDQIDDLHKEGKSHEQCEDELIARGYSDEAYGDALDLKYRKHSDKDGTDFLDEGKTVEKKVQESEADKEIEKLRIKLKKEQEALDEEKLKKEKEREESEEGKSSLEKSHEFSDISEDHSKEEESPNPKKYRNPDTKSGGTMSYTIWHCPKCKTACRQVNHKWVCNSPSCLYGKPKPIDKDAIPKEIVRYKLHLPELGCSIHRVKMICNSEGRYEVKEGQEDYIGKQVVKVLQNKTWKKLTSNQLEALAHYDKSKGLDD